MSPMPSDSANAKPSEAPLWVIMPIAGARQYTTAAISDVLAQTVPVRLLLIGQGLDHEYREELERICEAYPEEVYGWWFDPALSLAAAWNKALEFVWGCGAAEALVINNDIRLERFTAQTLSNVMAVTGALFVSAVAVTQEQFDAYVAEDDDRTTIDSGARGGPDFSCFLIAKAGHVAYPFDENFIPAYCEDLDTHRRYMLGGDAERIFSVNLPYLHYASGTLKEMSPEARMKKERAIDGARTYYARKWGGPVNQERFTIPFDAETNQDGVTTPELQRAGTGATLL